METNSNLVLLPFSEKYKKKKKKKNRKKKQKRALNSFLLSWSFSRNIEKQQEI